MSESGQKNIESIFPLSPMQEGMLFHSLYSPESGMYVEQLRISIQGALNENHFRRCWEDLIERHAAFRTRFLWKKQKAPLQAVFKRVSIEWREIDLRRSTEQEGERQVRACAKEDRDRGFDLERAPMARWTLIRLGETEWRLVWTWHHLLMDGWSLSLALNEVARSCRGESTPRPAAKYRDYIQWLKGRNEAASLDFWREELNRIGPAARLPSNKAPDRGWNIEDWKEKRFQFSIEESGMLKQAARSARATLNTLMHGAWIGSLSWHTGSEQVVTGVTLSGRPPELEGADTVIGLFINTVPAAACWEPGMEVRKWLQALQQDNFKRIEHGHLSLSQIQSAGRVDEGREGFETLFVFENYPVDRLAMETSGGDGLRINGVETEERTNYPLNVVVTGGERIEMKFLYDAGRYDEEFIASLMNACASIAREMAKGLDLPLHATRRTPRALLDRAIAWSRRAEGAAYRGGALKLLAGQCEQRPDACAVESGGRSISYGELKSASDRLALDLLRWGVQAEGAVALVLNRSVELVVAQVAALKAGGAFLPIDPRHPDERVRWILEAARARVVLTEPAMTERMSRLTADSETVVRAVAVDSLPEEECGPAAISSLPAFLPAERLAYIIFTSGSTGRPKGVSISHGALENLIQWHVKRFRLSSKDRASMVAGVGFDASVWEIWPHLASGAALIPASEEEMESPKRWIQWAASHRITTAFLPTPFAEAAFEEPSLAACGLRLLLTGGDRLNRRPKEALPFELVNNYGPTENAVVATSGLVENSPGVNRPPSIGRPIDGVEVRILDERMEMVPPGVAGELYIGGRSLSRGYCHRPDLTAERFVPDPFDERGGGVLYRTGDLARFLSNGEIEFLRRLDQQVQVRGYRIELGEIEAALASCPGVVHAAAEAVEDRAGETRIVAWAAAPNGGAGENKLREWAANRLPAYMRPYRIAVMEALPLTANGKIDRRALPMPELGGSASIYKPPRDSYESILCGLWAEVLSVDRAGAGDDFFERGGHSLLATQAVTRVNEIFGCDYSVQSIFERPTPSGFADKIREDRTGAAPASGKRSPIERAPVEGNEYPLSFAQERIWFLNEFDEGAVNYNVVGALRLRGRVDAGELESSLAQIVQRHASLRTTFHERDGRPFQRVHEQADVGMRRSRLEGGGYGDGSDVRRWMAEDAAEPFDLESGPLIRFRWIEFGNGKASREEREGALVVVMHHIIADGWSVGVFVRELRGFYRSRIDADAEEPFSALPIQYPDYAVWQRREAGTDGWRERLEAAKSAITGAATVLELPADFPRTAATSNAGAEVRFDCDAALTAQLKALSRRRGATLAMALQAAFGILLSRLTGRKDLLVGNPTANRSRRELEGLIGCFVNLLPVRIRVDRGQSFAELLDRVRESSLEAYARQDVPFETLVNALGLERNLNIDPLVQAAFTFQNTPGAKSGASSEPFVMETLSLPATTAKFDLELEMFEDGDCLKGRFEYRSDLFASKTIESWSEMFVYLLGRAVQDPKTALGALNWIPPRALARANELLAGPVREIGSDMTLERIDRIAASRRNAVAVRDDHGAATYGELIDRSLLAAGRLVELGTAQEDVVALITRRSTRHLALTLGILRTGAAFLPVDPSYPESRIRELLEESGARAAVVDPEFKALAERAISGMEGAKPALALSDDLIAEGVVPKPDAFPCLAPANLAYVIYTSGSTGRPKGAMVEHGGMLNHLLAKAEDLELGPEDTVAQNASQCFDISVWQFLAALLAGGKTRIYEEIANDPWKLFAEADRDGVTVLEVVPSVLSVFLAEEEERQTLLRFEKLRWLIPTGEAFPPGQARDWFSNRSHAAVVNAYGPTECSDDVTHFLLRAAPPATMAATPIGKPLRNLQIHVLDDELRPVPAGVYGELYVSGLGVGRGYLGRPELTAAAFLPDPFAAVQGARMYRTGDKGRLTVDGLIEYAGRLDHQVKVRGFRIELGEVEAALRAVPGVREGAALVLENSAGASAGLHAYYVADEALETGVLKEALSRRLPSHCIPDGFTRLRAMPLTVNGKLDRAALPRHTKKAEPAGKMEARTEGEAKLLALWKEALGLDSIGVDCHFFEAGGHSLLAAQVVSRARRIFKADFPIRLLFENPTVAGFSAAIARLKQDGCGTSIQRGDFEPVKKAEGPARPSFAQQRMWFMEQLEGIGGTYNISRAIRVEGRLDVDALERVFRRLAERHEALRTAIVGGADGPLLNILEPGAVEIVRKRVEEGDELDGLLLAESRRRFRLDREAPFRAAFYELSASNHVILMTVHHSASDGWSLSRLAEEAGEGYRAELEGREPNWIPLPARYADFALWQRTVLSGSRLERLRGFWKAYLADAPSELELPFDYPRAAKQTFAGASIGFEWDADAVSKIREAGRGAGASLFMTLYAIYAAVLARFSGSRDIVIGAAVAGRSREEFEPVVGLFMNTVPLRVSLRPGMSNLELIRAARRSCVDAFAHEELPFDLIVEASEAERNLGRHPLFQTMLILQAPDAAALTFPGVKTTPVEFDSKVARFDLTLSFEEREGGLFGIVEYNTDLFRERTIERMIDALERAASAFGERPEQETLAMDLIGGSSDESELHERNRTRRDWDVGQGFLARFGDLVERKPNATALLFEAGSMTYGRLDALSDRIAEALTAKGVREESRVAVCLDRGPALLPGLLGIWKAGGVYVPLDPAFPRKRLEWILQDSDPAAVLTQDKYWNDWIQESWTGVGKEVLVNPADGVASTQTQTQTTREGDVRSPLSTLPERLAYILYTSGSTGRPKGVGVSHGAMMNFLLSMLETPGIGGEDRLLAATTISFDISVLELFAPLICGGSVSIVDRETALDGQKLAARLERDSITVMQGTPSAWRLLLDSGWQGRDGLKALCGGEALSPRLAEELSPRVGSLWNMYGPTETTVWSAVRRVDAEAIGRSNASVPIGGPIANTTLHILDAQGRPVPVGVYGQLFIGGGGLARGYFGRADLTAERFVPNPFGPEGTRLYATGDKARIRGDGELEFAGRMDFQVKVRGFRIELGEIEAAMRAFEGVREAVVICLKQDSTGPMIVGYVVKEEAGRDADPEVSLKRWLESQLPDYMVPSRIVCLDAFPLLPNGKIHRAALPKPSIESRLETFVAPRTPVEEALCSIWAKVLGAERVGIDDGFFDLGGNSLGVMRLTALVQERLGAESAVSRFFERPTVRQFAEDWDELSGGAGAHVVTAVPRSEGEDFIAPQSTQQERLWFLYRLDPAAPTYHLTEARLIEGELDVEALKRSAQAVVDRHEILRTTFADREGRPVQRVRRNLKADIETASLQTADPGSEEFKALAREFANRPFDLEQSPPIRMLLVELNGKARAFLTCLHHIATDAWSNGILIRELARYYRGFVSGGSVELPPLTFHYADYAIWERGGGKDPAIAPSERFREGIEYWKAELEDAPRHLELPADYPRPMRQRFEGDTFYFEIDRKTAEAARRFAQASGVTLFNVFHAAYCMMLSRNSGRQDVVVGAPMANRALPGTAPLIGFFVNTTPLRMRGIGAAGFETLARQSSQVTQRALDYQDTPFELIVEALKLERDLSRMPVFQTLFVFQNQETSSIDIPRCEVSGMALERKVSAYDVTFALRDEGDRVHGAVEFNTDLFSAERARSMAGHFEELLREGLARPGTRTSRLNCLNEKERARALAFGTGLCVKRDRGGLVHETFGEIASRFKNREAVHWEGRGMTYGELDRRAEELAARLRRRGIGPEHLVGVFVERSFDMVVAVLGILKAGAAYCPLDPQWPDERLRSLALEADLSMVVAQKRFGDRTDFQPEDRLVFVDEPPSEPEAVLARDGRRSVTGDNLAYVIYTSGSTGKPKGVSVSHRALYNLTQSLAESRDLGPDSRVLLLLSFSFDACVGQLFMTLCSGGCLTLAPASAAMSGEEWTDFMEQTRVSHAAIPGPILAALPEKALPDLKVMITGGEAVSVEAARRWSRGRRFFNEYGPTETTVCATYAESAGDDWRPVIGVPMPNYLALVLDGSMNLAPDGVEGELYVGGLGVARGYRGAPALTAERFVPHPHATTPGERLYRTGDLARRRADGEIEFIGRADGQVKLRGYRIELGEIEAALGRIDRVRQAAVALRGDGSDKRLAAYLILEDGVDLEEVKGVARRRLPAYMVPSAWMALERMPMTSNGKVDRRALPDISSEGPAADTVEPRNDAERTLREVWTLVLKRSSIGIHDNFFELGGDSILSMQAASLAAERGLKIRVADMFERQTIAELAESAALLSGGEISSEIVTGAAPLTPIQRWFMELNLRRPNHWNQALLFSVPAGMDFERIEKTVLLLMARHEALRLRIVKSGGEACQEFTSMPDAAPVVCEDLSRANEEEYSRAVERKAAEAQASLDFEKGPIHRLVYFDGGRNRRGRLLWVIHHLAVDGVSWRILLSEFARVYRDLERGIATRFAARPASHLEWARYLDSKEIYERGLEFLPHWEELLQRCQVSGVRCQGRGGLRDLRLEKEMGGGVESCASDKAPQSKPFEETVEFGVEETRLLTDAVKGPAKASVNELLLAALAAAYREMTGESELMVDIESHGRFGGGALDPSGAAGWFTRFFPAAVRASAAEEVCLESARLALSETSELAASYSILRYGANETEAKRLLMKLPKAEAGFNYLGVFSHEEKEVALFGPASESSGPSASEEERAIHPIEMNGSIVDGMLRVSFIFDSAIWNEENSRRFGGRYRKKLLRLTKRVSGTEGDERPQRDCRFAVSERQRSMIRDSLKSPGAAMHVVQQAFELRGPLNPDLFKEAWNCVAASHPSLRACVGGRSGGEYHLKIKSDFRKARDLEWSDERPVHEADEDSRAEAVLSAERRVPFDLESGPLMRFRLIRLADDHWLFVWTAHHVLADGWSGRIILAQASEAYRKLCAGEPVRAFEDWTGIEALDRLARERSKRLPAAVAFWRKALANPPRLQFVRSAGGGDSDSPIAIERVELDEQKTLRLHARARELKTTPNALVQIAWALTLARIDECPDVLFGAANSGRDETEGSAKWAGCFMEARPVRLRVDGRRTLREHVDQAEFWRRQSFDFPSVGSDRILNALEFPERNVLMESALYYQGFAPDETASSGGGIRLAAVREWERNEFAVNVRVVPGRKTQASVAVDGRLASGEAAGPLAQGFIRALEGISVMEPDAPLESLKTTAASPRLPIQTPSAGSTRGIT